MARQILVKPIISEKAEGLSEKLNQYSFVVEKTANKIEIKKAVEEMYNVSVKAVNTLIMPGKAKTVSVWIPKRTPGRVMLARVFKRVMVVRAGTSWISSRSWKAAQFVMRP